MHEGPAPSVRGSRRVRRATGRGAQRRGPLLAPPAGRLPDRLHAGRPTLPPRVRNARRTEPAEERATALEPLGRRDPERRSLLQPESHALANGLDAEHLGGRDRAAGVWLRADGRARGASERRALRQADEDTVHRRIESDRPAGRGEEPKASRTASRVRDCDRGRGRSQTGADTVHLTYGQRDWERGPARIRGDDDRTRRP